MDGNIRLAVAGNPVAHSISPNIFYKLFGFMGIEGFYSRIAADSFKEAIDAAKMAGISGLNITSPFKEDAVLASSRNSLNSRNLKDEIVEKLRAANTVVIKETEAGAGDCDISLFNTDYIGVYESVKNIFPSMKENTKEKTKEKTAFVVGAGGAGIAAAYGLSLAGFNVTVFNRTVSKAAEKTGWIKNCSAALLGDINKFIGSADIIVNALPVNDIFFDISKIKKEAVIFDANYKNSVLIKSASERGLQTISGVKWLVNQAVSSFEIFTGIKPDDEHIDFLAKENLVCDKKSNISLIGFMGSGKTTTGEITARFFDTDFIDIDKEIEKKEKMTIEEIFKNKNENYFRQVEKRITENVFNNEKGKVIACGGGIIKESENRKIIAANSFPVWLIAPLDVSIKRIKDNSRPLLNREKKYEEAVKLFNERKDFYGVTSSLIIDSSKRSAQDTARKLYEEISPVFKS